MHTFFLTPGELNGVGLEVSLKSIPLMQKSTNRFIIWTEKNYLEESFDSKKISFFKDYLEVPQENGIYFIDSKLQPVDWFKESVEICKNNPDNFGIITGPLEKKSFGDKNVLGHTEYLRDIFPNENIFMTFFGDLYNCLLLTDHCSLGEVSNKMNLELIENGLKEALILKKKLGFLKPLALLGLNPHAGEKGLLGLEEESLHKKVLLNFKDISGPMPSDGFFGIEAYKKYSLLIANYHDQGLIPFKALNGFEAAQASIGLPFIRTSVDHGTASDIFGRDKANPKSMLKAIRLAEDLL